MSDVDELDLIIPAGKAAIDILDQSPPEKRKIAEKNKELEKIAEYDLSKMEDWEKHWLYECGRKCVKTIWETLYKNTDTSVRYVTFTYQERLRNRFSEKILRTIVKSAIGTVIKNAKNPPKKTDLRVVLVPEWDDTDHFHYHGIICGFNRLHLSALKRYCSINVGWYNGQVPKNVGNIFRYITKGIDNYNWNDIRKLCVFSKYLN